MSEVGNIINHKIKQNEILSRIVAQNYVGADGKAIDLKTQQGKLLSAKLSEALIGQGDNKKIVIPNAKVPHSNHIMAGADLSLVEKLDLGDGLTFVRSDLANAKKAAAATTPPKSEPTPAPTAPAEPTPAHVVEAPKAENTCPDEEAPAKTTTSAVADNPFSLAKVAEKAEAVDNPVAVALPAPEVVAHAEPVSAPAAPKLPEPVAEPVAAPVAEPTPPAPAEPVVAKEAPPAKEASTHPLTYTPGSFKASLSGGDKKPEDIDIPQLGEPEKPKPLGSTTSFAVEQDFAANEGTISGDSIPKGEKLEPDKLAFDF